MSTQKLHPLIRSMEEFLNVVTTYVNTEQNPFCVLSLSSIIFTFLVQNVSDETVRDELGMAIMCEMFPLTTRVADETLLCLWKIATSKSGKDIPAVIKSVFEHARRAREKERVARAEEGRGEDEEGQKIAKLHELLSKPISRLELSRRTANLLMRKKFEFVGQLCQLTEGQVCHRKDIGMLTIRDVHDALQGWGLDLGMDVKGWTPPQ